MTLEVKNKVKINSAVFIWILFCNLMIQLLLTSLEAISFCNWAFFLINILFFLITDVDFKERFIRVLVGSLVGIFAAGMLVYVSVTLVGMGVPDILCTMIPLTVCLAVIIILHPFFPRIFNNCAFAYFLVSLIDAPMAFVNMSSYMLSAVAGHFIVNIGTIIVIIKVTKRLERKG